MEASTRLNKNPLSKFNPLWIWLSIEAVLLCAILFANSVLCMLAVKLHAQYFMGQPMPWLSRVVFNHIPYDFRSILAGGILILSTFIALGFASGKKNQICGGPSPAHQLHTWLRITPLYRSHRIRTPLP